MTAVLTCQPACTSVTTKAPQEGGTLEASARRTIMSQSSLLRPIEEIAEFFARSPSAEEIAAFRLSEPTIARVRALLEKNAAGAEGLPKRCAGALGSAAVPLLHMDRSQRRPR